MPAETLILQGPNQINGPGTYDALVIENLTTNIRPGCTFLSHAILNHLKAINFLIRKEVQAVATKEPQQIPRYNGSELGVIANKTEQPVLAQVPSVSLIGIQLGARLMKVIHQFFLLLFFNNFCQSFREVFSELGKHLPVEGEGIVCFDGHNVYSENRHTVVKQVVLVKLMLLSV
nr:hypothetical protein [Sansalvadorimonas verongulae]